MEKERIEEWNKGGIIEKEKEMREMVNRESREKCPACSVLPLFKKQGIKQDIVCVYCRTRTHRNVLLGNKMRRIIENR